MHDEVSTATIGTSGSYPLSHLWVMNHLIHQCRSLVIGPIVHAVAVVNDTLPSGDACATSWQCRDNASHFRCGDHCGSGRSTCGRYRCGRGNSYRCAGREGSPIVIVLVHHGPTV